MFVFVDNYQFNNYVLSIIFTEPEKLNINIFYILANCKF